MLLLSLPKERNLTPELVNVFFSVFKKELKDIFYLMSKAEKFFYLDMLHFMNHYSHSIHLKHPHPILLHLHIHPHLTPLMHFFHLTTPSHIHHYPLSHISIPNHSNHNTFHHTLNHHSQWHHNLLTIQKHIRTHPSTLFLTIPAMTHCRLEDHPESENLLHTLRDIIVTLPLEINTTHLHLQPILYLKW